MFSRAIILLASLLLVQPADAAEKVDWVNVKCCGTDISVGKDGSAWLVGTDKRLYQWDGRNWAQDPQAQGVVRVAVAPDGTPWITNMNSDIWTRADGRWRKVHGKASDIAVGADGTVWTLGRKGAIYKRVGDRWQRISGKARRIAVDPKGNAWVINAGGAVYRFDGSKFVKLPGGNGQDIGIGAEGTAWLTTGKNNVYKWNGRAWILHTGKLTAISAGPDGNPWGLAATRKVFTAKSALASVAAAAKKRRNDDLLEPLKQHYPEAIAAIDPRRLRDEGTHLEAEHEIFGQKAGIVIYTPKGKRLPNIAFTFNKVDVNAVLDGLNKPNLMPLALEDLTLFLVPPGNGQDGVTPGQLPKILKQPVENVYKLAGSILPAKFDLEPGVNFLSRADASKRPDVNSLFGLIGLDATDDLTITGRLQRLAIKKHKAWKEPFGQKDMTIEKATILVITTNIADFFGTAAGAAIDRTRFAKPHYRNIAIWGNTNVKGRDYLVYGQQAYLRPSPKAKHTLIGTAYGFDAAAMTLGDMINLAKLLPWTRVMPLPPTGKMPLDIVTFTNPNHRPYNAVSYGVPPFTDMILVSATKGVTIPDGKPLPGSKGIPDAKKLSNGLRGTPGPLMYVNGGVELAGRELGNGDFSLSARGLEGAVTGAAGMTLGKMLGETVKLESGGSFTIEINNSKQLIALTSKTSAANFAKQDASITFTPKGGGFLLDMGCTPPIKIDSYFQTPSKPWESIDDLLLGVTVNHGAVYDCAGRAFKFIGKAFKEVGKEIAGAAKITAQVAANVSKEVAKKISGGFKTVGGKVVGLFKKKKKTHFPTSRDCDYNNGQVWLHSYGACWTNGHKYLYFAGSANGDGLCLQVNAAQNKNGSKLEFGKCDMNWTQQWRFDDGKIINAKGRCIDANGGPIASVGAKIQIYDCHGKTNQRWKLTPNGRIQGIHGLCIGAENIKDDADLKLVHCGLHSNRPGWLALAAGNFGGANRQYILRHRASGKCMDKNNGTRQGVPLHLWDCNHKNNNQKFKITDKIISAHSGNCYVDEGGAGVRGWNCVTSRSWRMVWHLERTTHGAYTTRNHISKKCLQVRGGVHKNGAIIEGGTCLGNWEQQWFLEPAR